MAAVMNVVKRTLSVSISRGQDADGNPASKSYTYNHAHPSIGLDETERIIQETYPEYSTAFTTVIILYMLG